MNFPTTTELSREDCETLVRNLDACIDILDQKVGRRSLGEIKIRSMVAVLRVEMAKAADGGSSLPPFVFNPFERRSFSSR